MGIQEGTFYRAYEWSAWLCCRYVNPFKVTRREDKSRLTADGTFVFVGFPITSLEKYVSEAWETSSMGEKMIAVSLPREVFEREGDGQSLPDDFAHWKRPVTKGVEFLGAFLLPYRTYASRTTLTRMDAKLSLLEQTGDPGRLFFALNSYCGVLAHGNNYHLRQKMLLIRHRFTDFGVFGWDVLYYK